MRKGLYLLLVVMVSTLLVGCINTGEVDKSKEDKTVEEKIESITFKKEWRFLQGLYTANIDTEKRTFVMYEKEKYGKYIKSTEDISKVVYKVNKNGEEYDGKIYLSEGDIKKYSKEYAEVFGTNMTIREE